MNLSKVLLDGFVTLISSPFAFVLFIPVILMIIAVLAVIFHIRKGNDYAYLFVIDEQNDSKVKEKEDGRETVLVGSLAEEVVK